MTSPREAVSILTAAALVVAPVGGVAATYTTGYAEDDPAGKFVAYGVAFPTSYAEVLQLIVQGAQVEQADLETMATAGSLTQDEYAFLRSLMFEGALVEDAPQKAQQVLDDIAAAQAAQQAEADRAAAEAEKAAVEKAAAEAAAKAEAEKAAAEEAADEEVVKAAEEAEQTTKEQGTVDGQPATDPTVSATPEGDVQPAETVDPADPDDSVEPAAPSTPTDPAGSADPVEPVDPADPVEPVEPAEPVDPAEPVEPAEPVDPAEPTEPADPADPDEGDDTTPDEPIIDTDNPVDDNLQKPGAAGGVTDASHIGAIIKGQSQTPLKQVAVTVPSISFTHIDNSAYVARHYSEDLTTEKFIALVGESARTIAAENDLYASVMIAQAILESASGNSTLAQAPNNNLFGIKGTYRGNSVQLPTREDDGSGATYTIMSDFRQYETVDESLSDYADLLSNSMGDFYAGARKSNSDSFVDACDFLVGRYATDIFYSEKLQDLIETYDLTRFDVPLTYELTDTFVLPVKDEISGLDKFLDPVTDKMAYEALVAEYEDYVARTEDYQQALAEWEEQMAAAERLYHVPVYLEKPAVPATDTPMQHHQDAIDAERFEGFEELIAKRQPLPVREARTLNDLTAFANSFLGVPYLWGGTTPAGFDCSGLVQYCYREVFNIELPRTTYYQCEVGEEVPFEELMPGDLLFFADGGDVHHVAMYLEDGYYIEAPHTGDVVKITSMNDKLPDFAKRVVNVRDIDMTEFSDEQLAQFVEREKYLQEREQRLGVTDETLAELTEWLRGLQF